MREAHGGTLFLDEIGDMPLSMQTRLLRVLQERQVSPLGGGKSVDVDFALICATHRKLREEADKGIFRSDLYYRINGLTVNLPALRERNDFQALTERILSKLNPERHVYLAPDLLAQLSRASLARQHPPVLQRAAHRERHAQPERELHRLAASARRPESKNSLRYSNRVHAAIAIGAPQNLKELSRSAIQQALESSRGNISEAARRLGISRQTLYRKLNT